MLTVTWPVWLLAQKKNTLPPHPGYTLAQRKWRKHYHHIQVKLRRKATILVSHPQSVLHQLHSHLGKEIPSICPKQPKIYLSQMYQPLSWCCKMCYNTCTAPLAKFHQNWPHSQCPIHNEYGAHQGRGWDGTGTPSEL